MKSQIEAKILMVAVTVISIVALVVSLGHNRHSGTLHVTSESKNNIIRVAKSYISLNASRANGVSVVSEKVDKFMKTNSMAIVGLRVKLTDGRSNETFYVDVVFSNGEWSPIGMRIITIHSAPPIGVPPTSS